MNRRITTILLALIILTVSSQAEAATIQKPTNYLALNTGLVGWWTFDGPDMTSNVRDRSGQSNNGNLTGQIATTTVVGKLGQAIRFDGSDDYVLMSTSIVSIAPMTVCAWFKANDDTTDMAVVSISDTAGSSQAFGLDLVGTLAGNPVRWYARNSSSVTADTTTGYISGQWHHACGVEVSPASRQVYIDGGSVGTNSTSRTPTGLDIFTIGVRKRNTESQFMNGQIDDVRIYSRDLSAAEITTLYRSGAASHAASSDLDNGSSLESGLVGHWSFDGKNMTSNVRDTSGQGNHGNLTGQTATTTAIGKLGQALKFDGDDDYVESNVQIVSAYPFSMSSWVKTTDTAATMIWLQDKDSANIHYGIWITSGNATIRARNTTVVDVGTCAVADNSWHHIIGIFASETDRRIYVDGQICGSSVTSVTFSAAVDRWSIGRQGDSSPSDYLFGILDDSRIYSRELSVTEIIQLYNLGR